METNYLPSLHNRISGPIFLLFIVCTLISCSELREALMVSLDSNHQVYNYGDRGARSSSPNKSQAGFNIGWLTVINTFYGDEFFDAVYVDPLDLDLLASTSNSNTFSLTHEQQNAFAQGMDMSAFQENIYIMTGLEFIMKRSKDGNERITLNYLEVPVCGIYKTGIGTGDIFGGFGLYFAYGIGGSTKNTGQSGDKVNSFNTETGFKRFDAGFSLLGGYQFANNITLFMKYDWGFANLSRETDVPVNNRTFSINAMYPFSKIFK